MNANELIYRYLSGEASEIELQELNRLLAEDASLRRKLIAEANTDAGLREIGLERFSQTASTKQKLISPVFRPVAWSAVAAAVVLLATLIWTQVSRPRVIATLVSGENAAWESPLPTAPGSALTAGYLKLTSGIATIQFVSGVRVILEAPAHLVLETPMRGRLLAGSAVIDVPKQAIGFIMEAPGGYAVDHGTQFTVSADPSKHSSSFEVLKGEISVHNPATGRAVRLTGRQGASISQSAMVTFDGANQEPAFAQPSRTVRIGTDGRADGVDRRNKHSKYFNPELLLVKQTETHTWDMRAFFRFDLSKVDLLSAKSARIRLNLVPSGWGLAARLPLVNTFAIYGVTRADREEWSVTPRWEDSPSPEDGLLLGKFDVPRSQQSGSVGIETAKLLEFLQADPDKQVTLVIVRETGLIGGEGKGLTHAFATDRNPEASGPLLEITMKDSLP